MLDKQIQTITFIEIAATKVLSKQEKEQAEYSQANFNELMKAKA